MSSEDVHRGSCRCGSVKFEVTGQPMAFFVCHCNNCRKTCASAFMSNLFFRADQYKYTQGEDLVTIFTETETTSGNPKLVSFCSKCGTTVRLYNDAKKAAGVPSGTFDDPIPWSPTQEVFTQTKKDWVGTITTKPL